MIFAKIKGVRIMETITLEGNFKFIGWNGKISYFAGIIANKNGCYFSYRDCKEVYYAAKSMIVISLKKD